ATARLVDTARQGVGVLGPGTPAAVRVENVARFLDFVSEGIARAAEQARDILHAAPESAPGSTPESAPGSTPASGARPDASSGAASDGPAGRGSGRD
ncbi:MarR family transcriptional regulator, partial [Streptomyces sp. SID724]|nr:MarR family transcriptional regulator [Streptomyces sp. SID724]